MIQSVYKNECNLLLCDNICLNIEISLKLVAMPIKLFFWICAGKFEFDLMGLTFLSYKKTIIY